LKTLAKVLGVISLALFSIGVISKYYYITGANMLQIGGLLIFTLGFAPLFLKAKLAEETRRDAKISYGFLLASSVLMIVVAQLRALGHGVNYDGVNALSYSSLVIFMIYVVFFSQPQEGRKLKIRKDRQLAAIVFTDIEGFTKLMGKDEDKGLQVLDQNRRIHKKWIAKFRGELLKELGDGNILIFYTATEAVLCCLEIQKETNQSTDYKLRMGIHISEIVFSDKDAFGDGMNIASRISGQAKGGEICVSESVYHNIRNREDAHIESVGEIELKNVEQPLRLFKINT
jgi:class 3 adenylate cyclase